VDGLLLCLDTNNYSRVLFWDIIVNNNNYCGKKTPLLSLFHEFGLMNENISYCRVKKHSMFRDARIPSTLDITITISSFAVTPVVVVALDNRTTVSGG
jgi:hypothetical protein